MALDYHFEPGSPRDVTLSVPLFALNQLDPARCEWLVPGMLKEKVHLLLKSLPQSCAAIACRCPTTRRDSTSAGSSAWPSRRAGWSTP